MNALSRLYELQRNMMDLIRAGESTQGRAPEWIKGSAPESRLGVYREAYRIRMIESLRDDFERVVARAGEEIFEELASEFIRRSPSVTTNLAEYSESFLTYLRTVSREFYRAGVRDWIEIVAREARHDQNLNRWDWARLGDADHFHLRANRGLQIWIETDFAFAAYRRDGEVISFEVSDLEMALLNAVKSGPGLVQLAEELEERAHPMPAVLAKVTEWVRDGVLICERIDHD